MYACNCGGPCPACGYCPHCGRGRYYPRPRPWRPPMWPMPYYHHRDHHRNPYPIMCDAGELARDAAAAIVRR